MAAAAFFKPKQSGGAAAGQSAPQRHVPWVEKYRPKTMDEVADQPEVVLMLRKSIASNNLPHLLLYGPPGTGKTSTILAVAKELFGPELYRDRVMELNASDERGINIVRSKIKSFAQVTANKTVPGYPCPPYKIIILDEADAMTKDAQSALRRTMETHSKVTRFCLICNYVSRIIDPITSRCAKFRFRQLDETSVITRLSDICSAEGLTPKPDVLAAVNAISGGDMRKAITFLQSGHRLFGSDLSSDDVREMACIVPDASIASLRDACAGKSFPAVQQAVQDAMADGHSASQLLEQLWQVLMHDPELGDPGRAAVALRFATADKALADGSDELLQLLDSLALVQRAYATPASAHPLALISTT